VTLAPSGGLTYPQLHIIHKEKRSKKETVVIFMIPLKINCKYKSKGTLAPSGGQKADKVKFIVIRKFVFPAHAEIYSIRHKQNACAIMGQKIDAGSKSCLHNLLCSPYSFISIYQFYHIALSLILLLRSHYPC
jgi:hypothetical protein